MPTKLMDLDRAQKMLREALGFDEPIALTTTLVEDLGIDEIDAVEIELILEEELAIELPDDWLDATRTVGDLIHRVNVLGQR